MKSYLNRRYAVEILEPTPQTQKTMVGLFIRRTIGKGLLNRGAILLTQEDDNLTTENGNTLITEQAELPIRTFRVIHGNGFAGSILGELIQHQYDYNVSDPNADHVGQVNKDDFAAAVAAWQALSAPDKKYYNDRAVRLNLHMSGYNLYIKMYRLNEL